MEKERFVKEGFEKISRRYDLSNAILSFGLDRYWRRETVKALGPRRRVLDLCAGTLALSAAYRRAYGGEVFALDFSPSMLKVGLRKRGQGVKVICGNALLLPFGDGTFEGAMMAFGLRNLSDMERGLEEIFRVLQGGGKAVILEFGRPKGRWFRPLYFFYLRKVLPAVAGVLTRERETYLYLGDSIMAFPEKEEVIHTMEAVGFAGVRARELSLGICVLYEGVRP